MEDIISKVGLYDLFARGVTGIVTLSVADLFGFLNILDNNIPVWAIILGGYFCGLVLEELSWILGKFFPLRKRAERKVCADYPQYSLKACKTALLANDKEAVMDEPLAHFVMSNSYMIAFATLAVLKCIDVVGCIKLISDPFINGGIDIFILIVLASIFGYRSWHYSIRRTKQIFDHCIAKKYEGIEN